MKDEYIERQAVIDAIHEEFDECVVWDESGERTADEVESIIDRVPSADVAPVERFRWIKTADGAECENCGREAVYQVVNDHWEYEPYCPHCGAKMKETE